MYTKFGDMRIRVNSETHRAHGGLWLENEAGEGTRIEPDDTEFTKLLEDYFRENF